MTAERIAATDRLRALCVSAGIRVSPLDYVREADLARLFGVSSRTVRTWRYDESGPQPTRIGGGYWYGLDGLAEYLARQEVAEGGRTGIDPPYAGAEDGAHNHPLPRIARK